MYVCVWWWRRHVQVQKLSPVGAYIQPTAGTTPGYADQVKSSLTGRTTLSALALT
jgi:cystathionine beta-lyase family protein involved in aluminum resistance